MDRKELTVAMVGSGGDGVVTMGDLIAAAGAREGLHVIKTEAYGPQIRGGESSCNVRLSVAPIWAQAETVDALIVFNWTDLARFRGEVVPANGAIVLVEEADAVPLDEMKNAIEVPVRFVQVPFTKLAKEAIGTGPGKNIVTLGLVAELLGLPLVALEEAVAQKLRKKGEKVVETNVKAFLSGAAWAAALPDRDSVPRLSYTPGEKLVLMSGNEASALGAIHAGCRFFAGYPITPSTEILQYCAEWLPKMGGTVVQTEDELSAYGAVIGASFAGAKAATATSGPGLSLMSELLGLSSMAEIPSVIIDVQRGGPSTGLPTKSEQSDLWHAVYGSHGDAPRVVLASSDVEDTFHATVEAFNIAEEFQMPVILLSDQTISGRREALSVAGFTHDVVDRKRPEGEQLEKEGEPVYRRYSDSEDGVSPMSIPGMKNGEYQTNGLEHDATGAPGSGYLLHEKMNEKRYRKLKAVGAKYRSVDILGDPDSADLGIVCWGSSKGAVREAIDRLAIDGIRVAAFVPRMILPFPKKELVAFLAKVPRILIIELSYAAQFYRYLRTFVDLPEGTKVYKRSGGMNLTQGEVEREVARAMSREEVTA